MLQSSFTFSARETEADGQTQLGIAELQMLIVQYPNGPHHTVFPAIA